MARGQAFDVVDGDGVRLQHPTVFDLLDAGLARVLYRARDETADRIGRDPRVAPFFRNAGHRSARALHARTVDAPEKPRQAERPELAVKALKRLVGVGNMRRDRDILALISRDANPAGMSRPAA